MAADPLLGRLRELSRVRAPENLIDRVLTATGGMDRYAVVDTAIGRLAVACSARGVSATMRTEDLAGFEHWYLSRVGRPVVRAESLPRQLSTAVVDELAGRRRPQLRYDLGELTPFEQAVLTTALLIPRGEVRPYAWVAREIGHPAAVRAVGSALARNPIPYLIPCHRVVRSDGRIGNYGGGGPAAKRAMLSHEGVSDDELDALTRGTARLVGSSSTGIFCYPTCRNARRVTARRRLHFASATSARRAGLRPCRVCRPAT